MKKGPQFTDKQEVDNTILFFNAKINKQEDNSLKTTVYWKKKLTQINICITHPTTHYSSTNWAWLGPCM